MDTRVIYLSGGTFGTGNTSPLLLSNMANPVRGGAAILLAGLLVGLGSQELLMHQGMGINLAILIFLTVGATTILSVCRVIQLRPLTCWLVLPMTIAGCGLAFYDSRGLDSVNILMVAISCGLAVLLEAEPDEPKLIAAVFSPLLTLLMPFIGLSLPFKTDWSIFKKRQISQKNKGLIIGLVSALPVLVILGVLLAQADPVFARLLIPDLNLNADTLPMRLFLTGAIALSLSGLWMMLTRDGLSHVFAKPVTAPPLESDAAPVPQEANDGMVSGFASFFGSIALLFLAFEVVQLRYLFGGSDVVLQTEGLTFAQYARRGFFEIATVTALTLPLLIAAQSLLKSVSGKSRLTFAVIAGTMGVLMLGLLGSAAYRMSLYVSAYGLSPMRLYVTAGMVWMALLIGLYFWLGLSWRLPRYGLAGVAAFFAVGLGLNMMRPDAVIARVNLARANAAELDQSMILNSGADAWPVIEKYGSPDLKRDWLEVHQSQDWLGEATSQMAVPRLPKEPKTASVEPAAPSPSL